MDNKVVAVSMAIICVVLVASLFGVIAYYSSAVENRDNTISSLNLRISQLDTNCTNLQNQVSQLLAWLNGNITAYQTQIATLNTQISKLYSNITDLQNQITSSNSTINLLTANITILQKKLNDLQNETVIPVSLDELQTNCLNYVNRTILVEGNLTGPMVYIPENMPPWNYEWVNYPTHLGVYWTGQDNFDSTPVIVVGVVREGVRAFGGLLWTDYFIYAIEIIEI